jgi:hypothetical protein
MRSATPSPTAGSPGYMAIFRAGQSALGRHRVQITAPAAKAVRVGHSARGCAGRVLDPGRGVGYQSLHHIGEFAADDRG